MILKLLALFCVFVLVSSNRRIEQSFCDIFVAGGTTAALSAALNAAKASPLLTICLTEPTDWLGGQLTASGVSAVDYGELNRQAKYQSSDFVDMMSSLGEGNPGNCWVSTKCYVPSNLTNSWIKSKVNEYKNLKVYYNTVVKSVAVNDRIRIVLGIQRETKQGVDEWDIPLSQKIDDWYSFDDSKLFEKTVVQFYPTRNMEMVVIDATEFGDVLALSKASYRIGVEVPFENSTQNDETCGQAFTFPFYAIVNAEPVKQFNYTTNQTYKIDRPWGQIWSYRRSLSKPGDYHSAKVGEVSNQNWGDGNDFKDGYLFLSKEKATQQVDTTEWRGGVDVEKLSGAEDRAFGWFAYYQANSPPEISNLLGFANKDISGTSIGLSKFPYIRDTRRSVGINGFVLKKEDLVAVDGSNCSFKFADRIAIGNYLYADIHGIKNCSWPSYISDHTIAPYYIPFRALTNQDRPNLLVAGKTMAQTFLANAATRLHPQEWNTGLAAGLSAVLMMNLRATTTQIYNSYMSTLQASIVKLSPINWDFCV